MIMVITPVHMTHEQHTTGEISLVYMAHTLGMFGFAAVTGWLIDRLGMRVMMIYGALLLIASSIMAPVATNVLTLSIALFILGLGWNFCYVAGSTLLSGQLHYGERGRVQGTNDMLVAMASGTGSSGNRRNFCQHSHDRRRRDRAGHYADLLGGLKLAGSTPTGRRTWITLMAGIITTLSVQKTNKSRVNIFLDGKFAFGLTLIQAAALKKRPVTHRCRHRRSAERR